MSVLGDDVWGRRRRHISNFEIFIFGFSYFCRTFVIMVMSTNTLDYYRDTVRIPYSVIGLLCGLAFFFYTITQPICGIVQDYLINGNVNRRHRHRHRRHRHQEKWKDTLTFSNHRSWAALALFLMGISSTCLSYPFSQQYATDLFVYLTIWSILWGISWGLADNAMDAIASNLTFDYSERSTLQGYSFVFGYFGMLSAAVIRAVMTPGRYDSGKQQEEKSSSLDNIAIEWNRAFLLGLIAGISLGVGAILVFFFINEDTLHSGDDTLHSGECCSSSSSSSSTSRVLDDAGHHHIDSKKVIINLCNNNTTPSLKYSLTNDTTNIPPNEIDIYIDSNCPFSNKAPASNCSSTSTIVHQQETNSLSTGDFSHTSTTVTVDDLVREGGVPPVPSTMSSLSLASLVIFHVTNLEHIPTQDANNTKSPHYELTKSTSNKKNACAEINRDTKKRKLSAGGNSWSNGKHRFKQLITNRPGMIILATNTLQMVGLVINLLIVQYYAKHVLRSDFLFTWEPCILPALILGSLPIWIIITKYTSYEKRTMVFLSGTWISLFFILSASICSDPSDSGSFLGFLLSAHLFTAGFMIFTSSMKADIVDYDEFLTGERHESWIAGLLLAASKIGSLITVVLVYQGLDMLDCAEPAGNHDMEASTAETHIFDERGLILLRTLYGAGFPLFFSISAVLLLYYKIDNKTQGSIVAGTEQRLDGGWVSDPIKGGLPLPPYSLDEATL